ncbi:serine/threonine protein kinase [Pueribacillus theae]|uniref:Serine/threonine protein kinase n=1 Tax=Pueribacillus theae TaxID=2171751 RepID=A0A2U1JZQ1_9BACI|nr:serine/threonine protein kinase [Pueribacillus theae]
MKGDCILPHYNTLAASVIINCEKKKQTLIDFDKSLRLIGKGRSAFVFRIKNTKKAMKVFFPEHIHIAKEEAAIYRKIQHIQYYPTLHEAGPNYLVIDYIDGHTLFDCLTCGIPISEDKIREIDDALQLAKQEGLNPSDIHLRNIFITSKKEIKIIDVARFRQTKACEQWNDLKNAFYRYYTKAFFPKKIPVFILNLIAGIYKKKNSFRTKKLNTFLALFYGFL